MGVALSLALGLLQTSGAQPPRILVEPDVIATRDGNAPHVEPHVAANPRNRNNLIGGAISHTRPDGTPASKAYYTLDGGRSWLDVSFPEQQRWGGADPQVAFSETGTAFFATLTTGLDDYQRTRALLHVYRSEDGGGSWGKPALLGWSYDHPMMTVDRSTGPFAGRVYVSVLYGRNYHLGLFRSSDDGRSFVGPVDFWVGGNAGANVGGNVLPMVVLSDGSLVVPFHDFTLTRDDNDPKPFNRASTPCCQPTAVSLLPLRGPVRPSGGRHGSSERFCGSRLTVRSPPIRALGSATGSTRSGPTSSIIAGGSRSRPPMIAEEPGARPERSTMGPPRPRISICRRSPSIGMASWGCRGTIPEVRSGLGVTTSTSPPRWMVARRFSRRFGSRPRPPIRSEPGTLRSHRSPFE